MIAFAALTVSSASAQESFFNDRYCTIGGKGSSGLMDCSFRTWAQCQESARGLGRYCIENPDYRARDRSDRRYRR
jgi:hypothetical protein